MTTVPLSARVTPDLARRVRESDLSLPAIIARGLDCTGHGRNAYDELQARVNQLEDWRRRHDEQGHATGSRTDWTTALASTFGTEPYTVAEAANAWSCSIPAARERLRKLAATRVVERCTVADLTSHGYGWRNAS